jgi:UDP-GlcNAc:undecaprenyl-phosphate GlcNAc-1-phosphate transferase
MSKYLFLEHLSLLLASFMFAYIASFFLFKYSHKLKALDLPDGKRKIQANPVSFLGGTAILLSLSVTGVAAFLVGLEGFADAQLITSITIAGIFVFILGIIDDYISLSPILRLVVQTLVAGTVTLLLQQNNLGIKLFDSQISNALISIIWIVFLCNAINLYDNTDLAASTTVFCSSAGIFCIAFLNSQLFISFFALTLCGGIFAFMLWNRPPARLYLGDSGALLLGVLLAVLLVQLRPNASSKSSSVLVLVFLVAMPIMDTSSVIIRRLLLGVSPFTPGRDHLSHRLLDNKFSGLQVILILGGLSTFFTLVSILLSFSFGGLDYLIVGFGIIVWVVVNFLFTKRLKLRNDAY